MNAETRTTLTLTIGDQTFRVQAGPDEEARLRRAAEMAHAAYEEIRLGGVVGGPRLMAMVAFQLAVELDEAREALKRAEESRDRLKQLIERLDKLNEAATDQG